jgi:hypothetical protein
MYNIPGSFLGMNNAGNVVYTLSSEYDESYTWHQTLNILELKDGEAKLVNALDLGQDYANVYVNDNTLIISYNQYNWGWYYYGDGMLEGGLGAPREAGVKDEPQTPIYKTKIQIIDTSDPENIELEATIGLKNSGSVFKYENDKLFIRLSDANGLVIYDLSDTASPDFIGYFPVQGGINSLRENVATGKVYLACGWYGAMMIDTA